MTHCSLALVGFGNVGRALARLLLIKRPVLESNYGITYQVNGIATASHGLAIHPKGLDLEQALSIYESGKSISCLSTLESPASLTEFIKTCPANVLFENSPVNYETGQPALDTLRSAIEKGMHGITANKGPVVHGYEELNDLAISKGCRFLFESAVMDGAPIFSLFRGSLPAVDLLGFEGILNSCTNLILGRMGQGDTFNQAVAYAQSIGIAETDPSGDIDGWDASIKVAALVTVLMGIPFKPQQVNRQGIRIITPEMIQDAKKAGERWKLVCRVARNGSQIEARVAPERVSPATPLYTIEGTSSYCQFKLDTLPGLGIVESNPGPDTTAFGLLADFINVVRGV
jgi:homoserine dehydrogenase